MGCEPVKLAFSARAGMRDSDQLIHKKKQVQSSSVGPICHFALKCFARLPSSSLLKTSKNTEVPYKQHMAIYPLVSSFLQSTSG